VDMHQYQNLGGIISRAKELRLDAYRQFVDFVVGENCLGNLTLFLLAGTPRQWSVVALTRLHRVAGRLLQRDFQVVKLAIVLQILRLECQEIGNFWWRTQVCQSAREVIAVADIPASGSI